MGFSYWKDFKGCLGSAQGCEGRVWWGEACLDVTHSFLEKEELLQ